MCIIVLFQPPGEEACYHGITGTDGVDQSALYGVRSIDVSIFCYESGTFSAHRNQNVSCPLFLQFFRIGDDFFMGIEFQAEKLSQFMIIRFDQEGMIFQHIGEQILGGIHHSENFPILQPCQNILISGCRHGRGNTSGQHQDISSFQLVQFLHKHFQVSVLNDRSLSVDLCPVIVL